MTDGTESGGRTVLSRAFSILDLFVSNQRALALIDIRDATGFPLATTHRYLAELEQLGALERLPSGRYQLGERMWLLGASSRWERLVRQTASPFLQLLSEKSGHAIALTVLSGERLIVLDRRWGKPPGISLADTGGELPLLLTSAGKVLLAHDRRETVESVLTNSISQDSRRSVIRKIDEARLAGYSIAIGELAGRQSSISVRVGQRHDDATLALTLITPIEDDSLQRFAVLMRNTASLLDRALKPTSLRGTAEEAE